MQEARRQFLKSLFNLAWDIKRCDRDGRTFASCLKGAWKLKKEPGTVAKRWMEQARRNGGHLRLSPSLIRSPIQRTLAGTRYGGRRDYQAAYTTAVIGR